MATASKRATVYLDTQIHRALRLKSAETERSISEAGHLEPVKRGGGEPR